MSTSEVVSSRSPDQRVATDSVGARLRARREDRGVSLRQFARELDVSASFISQLETGKARPSVATLYSICAALDMSIDELFATAPGDGAAPIAPTPDVPVGGPRDVLLRSWAETGEDRPTSPLVSP